MKVLLVDVNCKQGSTGKIVYDLYTYLRRNGHDAAVCYGRGGAVREPDICKISSNAEVYIHALLTRITGLTGYFSPFATTKLIRYIQAYQPDVVHLHDIHGYFVNIITLMNFLKKQRIRTVWTFHCEFMYTGKCGYSYECENWKSQCGQCPYNGDYPRSLFFDFTKKMLRDKKKAFDNFERLTIVTPSQWLANRAEQSFLNGKKIFVIPNGIDTDIFKPYDTLSLRKQYHLSDGEKVILHVTGSFEDKRKGGQYVIELAKRMPDVRFFIVGNQKKIAELPQNVTSVGRAESQTELAKFYSMADLFVITSKSENLPTVCIEAICCGTPVIGFAGGGTAETASEGYGVFVPFGDIDTLGMKMRAVLKGGLNDKETCVQWGKTMYDQRIMSAKYLRLYAQN